MMSHDELMWRCGFMPDWLKRELEPRMVPMRLPPWLCGEAEEEWRPFRDGTYDVSSHGRIRRAKPGIATFVGRPVQPVASGTGYAQVHLSRQRFYVHRVVAETFLGPCPDGHLVNHKDANKTNNALSNLEYVTARQNVQHALATVKRRRGPTKPKPPLKGPQRGDDHWSRRTPGRVARGERMGASKLTADIVVAIRTRVAAGEKQCDLAREFEISVAQTSRIVRGTRWAHVEVHR